MRKFVITLVLISTFFIVSVSAESVAEAVFVSIGGIYHSGETSYLDLEGQIDLSIFTLKFNVGEYNLETKDFEKYEKSQFDIGMNIKGSNDIFYLNLQTLLPLDDIIKGNMDNSSLNLRVGLGLKLYYFFAEAGVSSNLSFVTKEFSPLNAFCRVGLFF